MLKALNECELEGLSRIEISYYADSWEAQAAYFQDGFDELIKWDLDQVHAALNTITGTCHRVPLISFLKTFENMAK